MRHERLHLRQQARWGFGSVWVGLVPWGFAWLLLPLPLGLAWFRYSFEREAYAESIRAEREYWGEERAAAELEHAVEQLTGSSYGWAWPFKGAVRAWLAANSR